MARSVSRGPTASKHLTASEARSAINRFQRRITALEAFAVEEMSASSDDLKALEASIEDALDYAFGHGSVRWARYQAAAQLRFYAPPILVMSLYGPDPEPTPIHEIRAAVRENIQRSVTLIKQAISSLEEDMPNEPEQEAPAIAPKASSKNVFVVHGRDDAAKQGVARFLEKIGFKPVILHEQANSGQTIIEKFERHGGSAGFAVVLMTPDDVGGLLDSDLKPRPRQNVLLELGFFVGKLGREKVCVLKTGDLEVPSDFAGVVYHDLDPADGWHTKLAKELVAAGYDVDWNAVMKP